MDYWAKIKPGKNFSGVPAGEFYPVKYSEGDILMGSLARTAVKLKKAERGKGPAPENKMLPAALENKSLSPGELGELVKRVEQAEQRTREAADNEAENLAVIATYRQVAQAFGVDSELLDAIEGREATPEDIDALLSDIAHAREQKEKSDTGHDDDTKGPLV
ncbi:MAG: hypothetical protein DSY80_10445 [Desulfocapsa sp.]|nr:MAG: hypothetical protein DSY80_10445 [Desulfocapsa sp.]